MSEEYLVDDSDLENDDMSILDDANSEATSEDDAGETMGGLQEGEDTTVGSTASGERMAMLKIRRLLPNRRLDKYLTHRFPDYSRSMIQRLVKEGKVTVNDETTKNSYMLDAGDKVNLVLPKPVSREIEAQNIPLEVLYEDDHMIVINKQADLVVHPARGFRIGTMVNGLMYHFNELSHCNGDLRPGIVHRLDRNTSGVILVAKHDTAHWRLSHQFEQRLVEKVYMAVVHGTVDLDADVIDLPLGKHTREREKQAVRHGDQGKPASTRYEVIRQYKGYALVKLFPKTGRTHQLRVHMAAIKHPIVSDTMYGGKMMTLAQLVGDQPLPFEGEAGFGLRGDDFVIERQVLHAAEISIHHPHSGDRMTFKAPLKEDMKCLVDLLGKYRSR
jgi:23S rRNA pseudouridine1911/1915/1917 synthase